MVAAVLWLLAGSNGMGQTYTFTTIDFPSALSTQCNGISGDQIVGAATLPEGQPDKLFVLQSGSFVSTYQFEISGKATGISNGTYTAYQQTATSSPGTMSFARGVLDGIVQYDMYDPVYALGIDGQTVVGYRGNGWGNSSFGGTVGFAYDLSAGSFTDLINLAVYPEVVIPTAISGNIIVGYYSEPGPDAQFGDGAFVYDGTTWMDFANPSAAANSTMPTGVSGNLIVGIYTDQSNVNHGFTYTSGTWQTVDDPAGTDTVITGVCGTDLVGYFTDAGQKVHGFYASASGATEPSPTPVPTPTPTPSPTPNPYQFAPVDFPKGLNTSCVGVFGDNIVGTYYDSKNIEHGFVLNSGHYSKVDYPAPRKPRTVSTTIAGIYDDKVFGAYYSGANAFDHTNANPFILDLSKGTYTNLGALGPGYYFTGIFGNQVLCCTPRTVFQYDEESVVFDVSTDRSTDFTVPFTEGYQTYSSATQVAVALSGTTFVGWDRDDDGITRGFLASGATSVPLFEPNASQVTVTNGPISQYQYLNPALGTQPTGVDGGNVVGNYWDAASNQHGFILDAAAGDWTTVDCPLGNGNYTNVTGIYDTTLVGSYSDTNGHTHGFVATPAVSPSPAPTPEPTPVPTVAFDAAPGAVNVTGTFTGGPGSKLDKGTLLKLFGQGDVRLDQTDYYLDRDTGIVVLGSSDEINGDPEVIYGEVFRFGPQTIGAPLSGGKIMVSGSCTMLDNEYSGTFTGWSRNPATYSADHIMVTVPVQSGAGGQSALGIQAQINDHP
ncbi:MAG: hypothetical protein ABSE62_06640 [Chthoniobacteraceae bacterium]|jgi:hypothetical protein